jgi:hypothetical protein
MTEEIPEYLPGERECKRDKNGGRFRTGIGREERKEGAGCATKRERDDRAHVLVEWMRRNERGSSGEKY